MTEWFVGIESMIPQGQLGERMVVARINRVTNKAEIMCAPMMHSVDPGAGITDSEIFMTSGWSDRFSKNEIDQFLQAMMNAGWKRGLRPVGFDPSAGELAAVNRHLEDMRKLLHADPPHANVGQEAAAQLGSLTSDIGGGDKSW